MADMKILLSAWLLAACSSPSTQGVQHAANPCASKNATYLEVFTQMPGGTCGAITSVIVNVDGNGQVVSSTPITCAEGTVMGCTTRNSDCTFSVGGFSYTETTDATFSMDGSTATGLLTLTATGQGQVCASTYSVSLTRQ